MEETNKQMSNEEEVLSKVEDVATDKISSEKVEEIAETSKDKIQEVADTSKSKIKEVMDTNAPESNSETTTTQVAATATLVKDKEDDMEVQDDIVPLVKSNRTETNIPTIKPEKPVLEQNIKSNIQNSNGGVKADNKEKADELKNTNQTQTKKEKKQTKNKSKKGKKKFIILLLLLALIVGILSFIFGFITSQSNKIISGVSVNDLDVSNLTKSETVKKLESKYSSSFSDEITLKYEDYTKKLNPADIDAVLNIEDSVEQAYKIGRSENNIFANNFKVIKTYIKKENISAVTSFNDEKYNDVLKTLNDELPGKVIETSYTIDGENLVVTYGTSGNKVKADELKNLILNAILSDNKTITLPVEHVEAQKPDIEAIYEEVHKDPVDATFKTDPYEIVKEVDGIDFAISLDEAKQIAETNEESFTIPLKITKPAVTVKNLPQEAFPDLLGTFTTNFASSSSNRANNVVLAAQAINDCILMPGEEFSYNGTVGQRTAARGFKEAGVYSNGQVTTGIGGGICQVSSTLYNAVLLSDLEVVARSNHMFNPGYVPAGQDATVSWGYPDFKFKNNRDYPIKIVTSSADRVLVVSIYGLKKPDDYEVKVQSYVVGSIPFSTEYQDDPSMADGETRVIQGGSNGCRSATYKIYYKDGNEVSKVLVSNDTYNPHNQIVARGTAAPEPSPEPTPEPSPEPAQPSQDTPNTVSTDNGDVDVSF